MALYGGNNPSSRARSERDVENNGYRAYLIRDIVLTTSPSAMANLRPTHERQRSFPPGSSESHGLHVRLED